MRSELAGVGSQVDLFETYPSVNKTLLPARLQICDFAQLQKSSFDVMQGRLALVSHFLSPIPAKPLVDYSFFSHSMVYTSTLLLVIDFGTCSEVCLAVLLDKQFPE